MANLLSWHDCDWGGGTFAHPWPAALFLAYWDHAWQEPWTGPAVVFVNRAVNFQGENLQDLYENYHQF